ncbi:thioesterase II family protein [Actinomadura fibrosa]|uniref:Thioesterase II family protein n=1 Tax=Actinomadura fibrosa TaxID=111802 RepID=A0ABW2XG69_9ACTN|nr:thioesterase domain-containing protein [Actinomadura fibrosa]
MTANDPAEPWIRHFRHSTTGGKVLMACLPHLDACSGGFRAFAEALAPSIDVVAVRDPGARNRIGSLTLDAVAARADRAAGELRGEAGEHRGPVVLFGHGAGAVLAFEVARRLERRRAEGPAALFVAGCRAPSRYHGADSARRVLAPVVPLRGDHAWPSGRDGDEPPKPSENVRTVETYFRAEDVTVGADIVALGAENDTRAEPADVRAWSLHTDSAFESRIFPGGPRFLNDHFTEVINLVTDFLLPLLGGDIIDFHRQPSGRETRPPLREAGDLDGA